MENSVLPEDHKIIVLTKDFKITFKISETMYKDIGIKYIKEGYGEVISRPQENLKEYPMSDIGIFLFYDEHKKIASMRFTATDSTEKDLHHELHTFLEDVKDGLSINLYKAIALYWCVIEAGFSVISGINNEEDDDEDSITDLNNEDPFL
jgi:hypothetical protein